MSRVPGSIRLRLESERWRARGATAREHLRPRSKAQWALLALILGGIGLRLLALISWWPVTTTLSDAWPYSYYAGTDPFDNPQHPPGYSALLALLGIFTREVAAAVLLQHALGIVSALLLFAAVRRVTGSEWPALVPAGFVLLGGDQIYLEHSIMSESAFVFLLSVSLYSCVRAIDDPYPWWRWPLATAAFVVLATTVRAAGVFLIPVFVLAVILSQPRPWRPQWRPPATIAALGVALLVPYMVAIAAKGDSFGIATSSGWHLYHRIAPFADCEQFTPPEGSEGLCEEIPVAERPGGDFYLFDPGSPAVREFGFMGNEDELVGAFSRQAVLNQPGDYLAAVWTDLRSFYVPSSQPSVVASGGPLDPQLDWAAGAPGRTDPQVELDTERGMESFYNDFAVSRIETGLELLRVSQLVFRFGATALTIATLLTMIGLLLGSRRNRVGVLLFGVGGLALLAAPTLSGIYVGRYTVPLAGLLGAGAAIAANSIWRAEAERRKLEQATR